MIPMPELINHAELNTTLSQASDRRISGKQAWLSNHAAYSKKEFSLWSVQVGPDGSVQVIGTQSGGPLNTAVGLVILLG